jgi:uncharacterized protein YhbP (UPF0306 family)
MTTRNRRPAPSTSRADPQRRRPPPRLLRDLLFERSVLCLASASRRGPWCAPLFYAPMDGGRSLVFVSDPGSRHGRELAADPRAAAAVYLETDVASEVRGVQLAGRVELLDGRVERRARAAFLRRYPHVAGILAARPHEFFFAFSITAAKVTDNRRGFGFKAEYRLTRGAGR